MDVLIDGEIILYGMVGDDGWAGGFTARDVISALASIGRGNPVNVRINSGGGYTDDGAAIYNALKAHRGDVQVFVDGIAASAASIIAMAGDKIIIRKGGVMMIHDPSAISIGTARDHAKSMEQLEAVASSMADIYAERTGRPLVDIRAEMAEEIWLNAEQAVAKGYADEIDDLDPLNPTAFNYAVYRNAPERIMAFSSARVAASCKPQRTESMFTKEDLERARAEGHTAGHAAGLTAGATAERVRVSAILDADTAKGRETLAAHFAFKTDLAVDVANAALAAAPVAAAAPAASTAASIAERALAAAPTVQTIEGVAATAANAPKQAGAISIEDVTAQINAENDRARGVRR